MFSRLPIPIIVFLVPVFCWTSCNQINNAASKDSLPVNQVRIKTGHQPGSVEIADFNNDGAPDIVVASELDSNVTILLNEGTGKFKEANGSPFYAGHSPNDIAINDFNNDGKRDLAIANHDTKYITLLLGNGEGSFVPAAASPFPVEVLPHPHGLASGDFNHDGRIDIVTDSWGNDEVEILFGDSNRLFKTPGRFFKVGDHPYQRLRVADVNKDGNDDIITTNIDANNATVLLGDGKGNFSEAAGSPFPCGDAPFGVAVGDVNADGKIDLAVINSPASTGGQSTGVNGLSILLGDGTGKFSMMKGSPFKAGSIPNRVGIGDRNGDGINDIVVSDNNNDKIYLFLMSRESKVLSSSTIEVGNHPKGVATADLDKDGKGEIVVCNNSDNNISIISGN